MASKYQVIVEGSIKQGTIEKSLKNIEKNLSLTIKNIKIDSSALRSLQSQLSQAISAAINQAPGGRGRGGGGGGVAQWVLGTDFQESIRTMERSIEPIFEMFRHLGEDVKVKQIFDEEGIKKYAVSFKNVEESVEKTTQYLVKIDEETGHIAVNAQQAEKAIQEQNETLIDTSRNTSDYLNKWENSVKQMAAGKEHLMRFSDELKGIDVPKALKNVQSMMQQFEQGTARVQDVESAMRNLRTEVKRADAEFNSANKSGLTFTKMLETAINKIFVWMLGTAAIYGTLRQIREGVEYVKELNKALTDVQIVTGMNEQQVAALAKQYNNLAKELGATTMEVAEGSLEWFRQGKTIQETSTLMQSTMALSKLGAMEAADATEALTAILNGFNLEAEDSIDIVDKLIAVDNAYATSAKEIATALQYSSNSAQQAGVNLDELISYITTVSSVTRKSAESIGNSFKTMFARLENIKLGKMFEDETTTINDVEKALSLVDIQIRDTVDSFRPMGDVLNEIAGKWALMTETEQSAIATAIAGVRQRENFLVLMNNYSTVLDAQRISLESNGLALDRFGIYLDSVEAKTNKFRATWEQLMSDTFKSDTIKNMLDLGTALLEIADNVGVFNLALIAVSSFGMVRLVASSAIAKDVLSALITVFRATVVEVTALQAAIVGGLIAVAFIALFAAFDRANESAKELYENFQKLKSQTDDTQTELLNLAKEYETLASKQKLNSDELAKLLDIQSIVTTKYGGAKDSIDLYSDAVDHNTERIKENIRWLKEQARQEAQSFLDREKFAYKSAQQYLETPMVLQGEDIGRTPEEQLEYLAERIESGGKLVDVHKKIYYELAEEIDAMKRLIVEYEHYVNLLDAAGEKSSRNTPGDINAGMAGGLGGRERDFGLQDSTEDVQNLQQAFQDLQTFVSGPLASAYTSFIEQNNQLEQKAAELKSRIEEASQLPASLEKSQELFRLRQELGETNNAIRANADAYDLATKRILFDMILQRIGQMELAGDVEKAAYDMAYQVAYAWGLIDSASMQALQRIDGALFNLRTGEIPAATSALYELSQWANSVAGDYYIRMHVITDTDARGHVPEGAYEGDVRTPPTTVNKPPGGWYPGGLGGGGGGGGGGAAKKEAEEERISMQALFNMMISLIRQEKQEEIDLLKQRQDALSAEQDLLKEQQAALDEQLDAYGEIIDARKELLRTEEEELSYQEEIADRNESIAKLQQQMAILQLDDSLEAQAKRLQLEEKLNKELEDLARTQRDHSYDAQAEALDKEYDLYADQIEKEKDKLDERYEILEQQKQLLQDQIDIIQDFLSKSGLIAQEAMDRMAEKAPDLYEKLIEWNSIYGSGIKEDVVDAWNEAYEALRKYGDLVEALRGGEGGSGGGGGSTERTNWKRRYGIPEGTALWDEAVRLGKKAFLEKYPEYDKEVHHTGLASGPVGGFGTQTNEVFARLFKGEVVLDQKDMLSIMKRVPELAQAMNTRGGMGNIIIDKVINVEGDVDKDVVVDLKKLSREVVGQINANLIKRGYLRGAQLFSA